MANPVLKFETNKPVEVALTRKGPGMEVESKFGGIQYLYTLKTADGERTLYASEDLSQQIDKLDLNPGQHFTICKGTVKRGEKTLVEWTAAALPAASAKATNRRSNSAPTNVQRMPTPSVAEEVVAGIHPAAQGTLSALMTMCLQGAFDAWQATQHYAAAKGQVFQFEASNVQATASTMFIQLSRDGQMLMPRIHNQQGGAQWQQ